MGAEVSLDVVEPERCAITPLRPGGILVPPGQSRTRKEVLDFYASHLQGFLSRPLVRLIHPYQNDQYNTPCELPLGALERKTLKGLRRGGVHRGVYLLARTIAQASVTPDQLGITTVVEDPDGNVEIISIYNYGGLAPPSVVVAVGAPLVIKEPHSGDFGFESIRVEHPTDLLFFDCYDPRVTGVKWSNEWPIPDYSLLTPTQWREGGNAFFDNGGHYQAYILYTGGLITAAAEKDRENMLRSRLNRAAAAFRMQRYEVALLDTELCLQDDPGNEGALFARARSFYVLRMWEEAEVNLRALLLKNPKSDSALEFLTHVQARIREAKGEVTLDELALSWRPDGVFQPIDFADMVGPLEIKFSPRFGRVGVFLTEDVTAGQLLLIEKALVSKVIADVPPYSSEGENALRSCKEMAFNSLTKELICLVHHNPVTIGVAVSQLRVLTKTTSKLSPYVAVDACHIRSALDANTRPASRLRRLPPAPPPLLERVNSWWPGTPYCLYHKAALINPCCVANTFRIYFGDLVVVRAVCDLPAGTEITESYVPPWYSYEQRESLQARLLTAACPCSLCQLERCAPRAELLLQAEQLTRAQEIEAELAAASSGDEATAMAMLRKAVVELDQLIEVLRLSYERCQRPVTSHLGLLQPLLLRRALAQFTSDGATICSTSRQLLKIIGLDSEGLTRLGPYASRVVEIYLTIAQWTEDAEERERARHLARLQQMRYTGLQEPTLRLLGLAADQPIAPIGNSKQADASTVSTAPTVAGES